MTHTVAPFSVTVAPAGVDSRRAFRGGVATGGAGATGAGFSAGTAGPVATTAAGGSIAGFRAPNTAHPSTTRPTTAKAAAPITSPFFEPPPTARSRSS